MSVFYISKLDKQVKENLLHHAYNNQQVEMFIRKTKAEFHKKQKGMIRAILTSVIISAFLLIVTYMNTGFTNAFIVACIMVTLLLFGCLLVTYIMSIGYKKFQVRQILKKTYPEYLDLWSLL